MVSCPIVLHSSGSGFSELVPLLNNWILSLIDLGQKVMAEYALTKKSGKIQDVGGVIFMKKTARRFEVG